LLYEIRNHSGARDVFLDGQKYYFPRQGTLRTEDKRLVKVVSTLPNFSTVEVGERKKHKAFTSEHKRNMSIGQAERYKREEAKKDKSELINELI